MRLLKNLILLDLRLDPMQDHGIYSTYMIE